MTDNAIPEEEFISVDSSSDSEIPPDVKQESAKRVLRKKDRPDLVRSPHHERRHPPHTSLLPLIATNNLQSSFRVDESTENVKSALTLKPDFYRQFYYEHAHYNFIGVESSGEHFVISVLVTGIGNGISTSINSSPINSPSGSGDVSLACSNGSNSGNMWASNSGRRRFSDVNLRRALKTTRRDYSEFELVLSDDNVRFRRKIIQALWERENGKELYYVTDTKRFADEFVGFENKHPQRIDGLKIGVIYCKPGQVHPQDMFKNKIDDCGASFWDWLKYMGTQISLEDHKGYRGDMSAGKPYYTVFEGIEVIYHVAPLLEPEGHRRLIGNDVAVIIFIEESEENVQFDPSQISFLGTMPQVFVVVQPHNGYYRLGFFSNINIKSFGPSLPRKLVEQKKMKKFILTKLHNGQLMTKFCPPINRLFFVPRGETLEKLVMKFPAENEKSGKARKKEESKEIARKRVVYQEEECLRVKVIAATNIVTSPEKFGGVDPFLSLTFLDRKEKTKPVKNTSNPVWNEFFTFPTIGCAVHSEFKVICFDNSKNSFMGETRIPFEDILMLTNTTIPQSTITENTSTSITTSTTTLNSGISSVSSTESMQDEINSSNSQNISTSTFSSPGVSLSHSSTNGSVTFASEPEWYPFLKKDFDETTEIYGEVLLQFFIVRGEEAKKYLDASHKMRRTLTGDGPSTPRVHTHVKRNSDTSTLLNPGSPSSSSSTILGTTPSSSIRRTVTGERKSNKNNSNNSDDVVS